jgi:hypothetical protein
MLFQAQGVLSLLSTLAPLLIAASAAIILLLGSSTFCILSTDPSCCPATAISRRDGGGVARDHARNDNVESRLLLTLGCCCLAGMPSWANGYCFSVPFRGIVLATVFYVMALIINWA